MPPLSVSGRRHPEIVRGLIRYPGGMLRLDRSAPVTVARVPAVLAVNGDPPRAAPTATFQIDPPHGADLSAAGVQGRRGAPVPAARSSEETNVNSIGETSAENRHRLASSGNPRAV